MKLRLYQEKFLEDIRLSIRPKFNRKGEPTKGLGYRRVCAVLPTGGGKTVIFSAMAAGAVKLGKVVWAVAHRERLIQQMSSKFQEFGLHHGIIRSGIPETPSQVQCAMIQTLKNRLAKSVSLQLPDLLIIDECHHTPSNTYDQLIQMMPPTTFIVGFTATPERLDGKGLGQHFEYMIVGPREHELISMGFLARPVVFCPPTVDVSGLHSKYGDYVAKEVEERMDKPQIIGDIIEHYKKLAGGKSTVCFVRGVAYAAKLAQEFCDAGVSARHIEGEMTADEQAEIMSSFEQKKFLVLISVDLVSEGVDVPGIECVILARPSKSLALLRQMMGRGLRVFEGKDEAIIIDHVKATDLVEPDEPIDWSLFGAKTREKDEDEKEPPKTCSDCFRSYRGDNCPSCGLADRSKTDFSPDNGIEHVEGELVLRAPKRRYLVQSEYESLLSAKGLDEFKRLCAEFDMDYEQCRKIVVARAEKLDDLQRAGNALGYKGEWARLTYARRHGEHAATTEVARLQGFVPTSIDGLFGGR